MGLITPYGSPKYVGDINALVNKVRQNRVGGVIIANIVKQVTILPISSYYDVKKKKIRARR